MSNIKHGWVKIFGGVYIKFEGTLFEESYSYKGKLISWIECKRYNFRKKRLFRQSDRIASKLKQHNAKFDLLQQEYQSVMDKMKNFN